MKRRTFTTELAGILLAAPWSILAAQVRQGHIGVLSPSRTGPDAEVLLEALGELGYVDGRSAIIEWATSEGDSRRFAELAAELVRHKVDILIALGSEATQGAKEATRSIPIVFSTGDPVGAGFVESLARPGGNLTGATFLLTDLAPKYLQLVRDVLPDVSDVVVLWTPANASMTVFLHDANNAAPQFRLRVHPLGVSDAESLDAGLAAVERSRPRAMIVLTSQFVLDHQRRIADFALRNRLVTLATSRLAAENGLLMSYGPTPTESGRQIANYVHQILKGAKPANLPIQQPTKFELVINLKTAKALGITIPQPLLLRADEVIQ